MRKNKDKCYLTGTQYKELSRVVSDIQAGLPVLFQGKESEQEGSSFFIAADSLHSLRFDNLQEMFEFFGIKNSLSNANIRFVMSKNRVNYLEGIELSNGLAEKFLAWNDFGLDLTLEDLGLLMCGQKECFDRDFTPSAKEVKWVDVDKKNMDLGQVFVSLIKKLYLLPAYLEFSFGNDEENLLFAQKNQFLNVSVNDVNDALSTSLYDLKCVARADMEMKYISQSQILSFACTSLINKSTICLVVGDLENEKAPLVRMHSSCYTGDLLNSFLCDCGDQLQLSLQLFGEEEKKGRASILIYLMQEGRDIGLVNKIRAYDFQRKLSIDTVDANLSLGFEVDERDFTIAKEILRYLKINDIRLLTNNPIKVEFLEKSGVTVSEVVDLNVDYNDHNKSYIKTKKDKLGHDIALD